MAEMLAEAAARLVPGGHCVVALRKTYEAHKVDSIMRTSRSRLEVRARVREVDPESVRGHVAIHNRGPIRSMRAGRAGGL